jgi:uncharacterized protein (UPF0210 family)
VTEPSRREVLALLGAAAWAPLARGVGRRAAPTPTADTAPVAVRTITAGTTLRSLNDLGPVEAAIGFLHRARRVVETAGYTVQTVRVATQPFLAELDAAARAAAVPGLQALDRAVGAEQVIVSLGPVLGDATRDADFAAWAGELARTTRHVSFSVTVASPERGVAPAASAAAARAMVAIAQSTPGGTGNFRFAAAARVPPGTPFFPVAYHRGPAAFALGLQSPSLFSAAFAAPHTVREAQARLQRVLEARLGAVEQLAVGIARREQRRYLGIDASPAPGPGESSIGAAIEALTGVAFGGAGTLAGCAAITDVLKRLQVKTCGYSGLMLPVLEDPVLARRAREGRYSVRELLLYSSVCGTGLDTVPLPGDTPPERLAALVGDVAALATKLRKPLSARLFPVPGKAAGEIAHFDEAFLTDAVVLRAD